MDKKYSMPKKMLALFVSVNCSLTLRDIYFYAKNIIAGHNDNKLMHMQFSFSPENKTLLLVYDI